MEIAQLPSQCREKRLGNTDEPFANHDSSQHKPSRTPYSRQTTFLQREKPNCRQAHLDYGGVIDGVCIG